MRRLVVLSGLLLVASVACGQTTDGCSCGANPPGRPSSRSLKPYGGVPEDLRPYSKFTSPYYEH
jgi:branched-chain amino acid transport system substrate-binding protein